MPGKMINIVEDDGPPEDLSFGDIELIYCRSEIPNEVSIHRMAREIRRQRMKRDEFNKQRESLYREILKQMNLISNNSVVQSNNGPREASLELVKLYKKYNDLVDEYIPN